MDKLRTLLSGMRARVLLAPTLILILFAALGAASVNALSASADRAAQAERAMVAIEVLRDANSRQFEAARAQFLALAANEESERKASTADALQLMQESIDGYSQWARQASPAGRAEADHQVAILTTISNGRKAILDWRAGVPTGTPLPAGLDKRNDATEALVDKADGLNDVMVTSQQTLTNHLTAAARSAEKSARNLVIVLLLAGLVLGIAIALLVARSVRRRVLEVLERLRNLQDEGVASLHGGLLALADGDLTVSANRIDVEAADHGDDELGRLATTVDGLLGATSQSIEAYNSAREQLGSLVGDVRASAGAVSTASNQVAVTSEEAGRAVGEIADSAGHVAAGAERQVHLVETARESVTAVAGEVRDTAATAMETREAAGQAREYAREGVGAAERVALAMDGAREVSDSAAAAMAQLAERSTQIGTIVGTITQLAEQTNLLALNAAIEAARAGEQGRGFAVVAEEVRKLAEGSQAAAGDIASLVAEIQGETRRVVTVVEDGARRTTEGASTVGEARAAFERIDDAVRDMAERIDAIATAADRITAGAASMEQALDDVADLAGSSTASSEQMSATTQETSASTQEIASAAAELARTAETLDGLVRRFRVTV
jgi:methyl-accepting chemotaxis protein